MLNHDDTAALRAMLEGREYQPLRLALSRMNAVDAAEFIETLPPEQRLLLFRMMPKDMALLVFTHFDEPMQQGIIRAITDQEVAALMKELWMDDALEMLEELPATLVNKVLRNSPDDAREWLNQYLHYPEDSVGRAMTAEYIDLKKNMTVAEALGRVKALAGDAETIYTCFVTDEARVLESALPLKDLLFARDSQSVSELLSPNPIYATTMMDEEEAARLMLRYNLISLPVVDGEKRLVGIMTVDDAVDTLIEADTEDFERMAAMRPSETAYTKTSPLALAWNRLPWLVVSLLTNILISFVVDVYEPVFVAMPILVSFMPMLMGTGGNAGSQTSTLIIRGMAVGEIALADFGRVVWKEARVCLALGLALGAVNFARIALTGQGQMGLALVVSVALVCGMLVGKLSGVALPMAAKALGIDPALMSSPILSTIVDIAAVAVFFSLAQVVFPL